MRVVLDTNVLIAAFLSRGLCHELLEHLTREHDLYTSEAILGEFRDRLTVKLGAPADLVEEAVALLLSRMERIEPAPVEGSLCDDPDDAAILGTALAASAACLVTGDKALLKLERVQGVEIVAPALFWRFEARMG